MNSYLLQALSLLLLQNSQCCLLTAMLSAVKNSVICFRITCRGRPYTLLLMDMRTAFGFPTTSLMPDSEACSGFYCQAGTRLGLKHKTAFAAVNYFDRFLSESRRSRNWETWMVQLISIACLSIASKFEEVCHPTFAEFQVNFLLYTGHTIGDRINFWQFIDGIEILKRMMQMKDLKLDRKFDPSTIKEMELLVLKVLDWKLNCVTSYSYLELLGGHLSPNSMARITDRLIDTLFDITFLEHNPVVVAVSVLRYAVEEIAPMRLDFSFTPLEPLISEELKAKIHVCSKVVEHQNAQK